MKKFEVMFNSLFIIGLLGSISGYFLFETQYHFVFLLIMLVAILPKVFLEMFLSGITIKEHPVIGTIRVMLFYSVFAILSDLLFIDVIAYLAVIRLAVCIGLAYWGNRYLHRYNHEKYHG